MRYIDITRLREVMGDDKYEAWEQKAANHLTNLRKLTKSERSKYFERHGDWTELYRFLSELSNHKCWYTEALENSGEWEIDHFRPKNRAKNHDGEITLEEGYWWLAYDWNNYRLAGSFINKRRKDKFNQSEEVFGKGDYFPLDLTGCSPIEVDGDTDDEVSYLLDPVCFRDTTLIGFDKDGKPLSHFPFGTFEERKVSFSIEFLHLDNSVLNRNRQQTWLKTEREIKKITKKLIAATNQAMKNKVYNDSYNKLKELTSVKEPYSSVAINCLVANQEDHPWIKNMIVLKT